MSEDIFSGLNERQREAVCLTEGFIRIIAGAGSGKTRALTRRYAYLTEAAGIHPGNILCVTFTHKAAGEMKARVRSLIGGGCDTSLITTYHGFCARVLREDIGRLFYPERFSIADTSAQKKILSEIYASLDLKLDHASFEDIIEKINKRKSTTDYVDYMLSRAPAETDGIKDTDEKIICMYMQRQKKIFSLDFNDLINFTFVLFERFPAVRDKWQKRLCYIQVDEFQDSSAREQKLLDILCAQNRNLFVVGDPDQNIYEWRGADVGILVGFDKAHNNCKTVIMDRNYRSTPNILRVANELIAKNCNRVKKTLYTEEPEGEAVVHLHGKDEKQEAQMIVSRIRELVGSGDYGFGDITVLYRATFVSEFIERALLNESIPYETVGSVRFFDRSEIRDAIAYLTLAAFDSDEALARIINLPRRKFGKSRLEMLAKIARAEGTSLLEALRAHLGDICFAETEAGEFVTLIDSVRAEAESIGVSEALQKLLTLSGYEKYVRESGNMERLDNLGEFKRITLEYERGFGKSSESALAIPEPLSINAYIQQLTLMREEGSGYGEKTDKIKLMTVHAAKGLEFPVCFVVGMTDGIFPSARTLEQRKQAGLEEERRLCFVALTRAQKRLYLTDSEGEGGGGYAKTPSRFLFEMGENNYTRIGTITKEARKKLQQLPARVAEAKKPMSVGERVKHPIFGEGEITAIDSERGVYLIRFADGAVKPISSDYDFEKWSRTLAAVPKPEQNPELKPEPIPEPLPEPLPEPKSEPDPFAEEARKRAEAEAIEKEKSIKAVLAAVKRAEESAKTARERQQKLRDYKPAKPKAEAPTKNPTPEAANVKAANAASENAATADAVTADVVVDDSDNLWKRNDVPHEGWSCIGIVDLGQPTGICRMCGKQIIRYVHQMKHPNYKGIIGAGCVCAGRMEGNAESARRREADFKNRASRRESFIHHKCKISRGGNSYFKVGDETVTVLPDRYHEGRFKAVFRGTYTASYETPAEALEEIFDTYEM